MNHTIRLYTSYTDNFIYSNLTYALLGRLLVDEYLKQITFEDYVKEKILDPLKLADTGFSFTNELVTKHTVLNMQFILKHLVGPESNPRWLLDTMVMDLRHR